MPPKYYLIGYKRGMITCQSLPDLMRTFALKMLTINSVYRKNFTLEAIQSLQMRIDRDQNLFGSSIFIQSFPISQLECVKLLAPKLRYCQTSNS